MNVKVSGHTYELSNFENKELEGQKLQFIHKDLDEHGQFVTINDGTTNEEVIEVLIDRLTYLNSKFPCRENSMVITKLDEALLWLEKRTKDRIKRNVEGQHKA
jgi:hypothetical protein